MQSPQNGLVVGLPAVDRDAIHCGDRPPMSRPTHAVARLKCHRSRRNRSGTPQKPPAAVRRPASDSTRLVYPSSRLLGHSSGRGVWSMPIAWASSTATSSRRTCWWTPTASVGRRLRPGPGRSGGQHHRQQQHVGHAPLYEPGAVERRPTRAGPPDRHLLIGRHALRDALPAASL